MLAVATALIAEKGSETVRMNEIAEGAGVSIGSLYQYFPDKTAIVRTLAERYNAQGRACVEKELGSVASEAHLVPALARIVDAYYAMFLAEPAMRDIWWATQGDKSLQALDAADGEAHTALLHAVLVRLRGEGSITQAMLTMHLLAATVRLAIVLDQKEGKQTLEAFKGALPALVQVAPMAADMR
jgi:AcrR family transcriptional regulator